jgi:hypothetical protein
MRSGARPRCYNGSQWIPFLAPLKARCCVTWTSGRRGRASGRRWIRGGFRGGWGSASLGSTSMRPRWRRWGWRGRGGSGQRGIASGRRNVRRSGSPAAARPSSGVSNWKAALHRLRPRSRNPDNQKGHRRSSCCPRLAAVLARPVFSTTARPGPGGGVTSIEV